MTRTPGLDRDRLRDILASQHQVITCEQAYECGLTRKAVDYRLRLDGPWQWLLPAVYVAGTGVITQNQRVVGALLYAGPGSVMTGPAAVRRHHLTCAGPDAIDVLIPWTSQRKSSGFVRVHRTRRMPERGWVNGAIRYALPARAVGDAARLLTRFDDVRAVVSEALLTGRCTLAELAEELQAGGLPRSAYFREALAEVTDGIRSVAEARFRRLILSSGLPRPMFNARLYDERGAFIAMVDAWWERAGVAVEVDSRAYHSRAKDQDRTADRHAELVAHGILPLHFAPQTIRTDGRAVVSKIGRAVEHGQARPPLPIRAFPVAA
jgi:hypothetical protein